MRATRVDQPHGAGAVTKREQGLAHHLDAQRRAVGFGELARQGNGLPEPPEIATHRRVGSGLGETIVIGGGEHQENRGRIGRALWLELSGRADLTANKPLRC